MPCKANYKYTNLTGGVRFPKTLWVSDLKLGAVGGARSGLIWVLASQAFVDMGQDTCTLSNF